MGWINTFQAWGEAERADPADETVINGAPYDAPKEIRNSPRYPAAPGDPSDAGIAEEIKQRQISAVVRYVTAWRAR